MMNSNALLWEVRNMLEYLATKHGWQSEVNMKGDVFTLPALGLGTGPQDRYVAEVDFAKQVVIIYGWDISGHNGDEYGETKRQHDWTDALVKLHTPLKGLVANAVKRDIEKQRAEKLKREEDAAIEMVVMGIAKRT